MVEVKWLPRDLLGVGGNRESRCILVISVESPPFAILASKKRFIAENKAANISGGDGKRLGWKEGQVTCYPRDYRILWR